MSLLREMGYDNVRHLAEGIAGWEKSGAPMEKGAPERSVGAAPTAPSPLAEIPPGTRAARARAAAASHSVLARVLDRMAGTSYAKLVGVWLTIVFGCGIVYWLIDLVVGNDLREGVRTVPATVGGFLTSLYFSFVTATSIGFGDVVPLGPARFIAVLEGAAGLLIFGAIISKLVSKRQDDLIAETHRIAYEVRLGRVRTNLHLVLSDMQNMSSDFRSGTRSPEFMLPRLESAVMVFSGELRTIHDLLYRPQDLPEDSVLESLLANLASVMRALDDMLHEFPRLCDQSSLLSSGVRTIAALANEICGECVPRDHTPALKRWMDLVQNLASHLVADRDTRAVDARD